MTTVNLDDLGEELLRTAAGGPAGRAARRLEQAGEGGFSQSLLALLGGQGLGEHESPASASLQVLRGRIRFRAAGDETVLRAGDHLALPPLRHAVDAIDDTVLLLTVAPG
jgi:quercetin dioxygenase-like cupin family protein